MQARHRESCVGTSCVELKIWLEPRGTTCIRLVCFKNLRILGSEVAPLADESQAGGCGRGRNLGPRERRNTLYPLPPGTHQNAAEAAGLERQGQSAKCASAIETLFDWRIGMRTGIRIIRRGGFGLVSSYQARCACGFKGAHVGHTADAVAELQRHACQPSPKPKLKSKAKPKAKPKTKPLHCRGCGKQFRDENTMELHFQFAHEARECPFCGARRIKVVASGSLEYILAVTGTTPKKADHMTVYRCSKCGRQESSREIAQRVNKNPGSTPVIPRNF